MSKRSAASAGLPLDSMVSAASSYNIDGFAKSIYDAVQSQQRGAIGGSGSSTEMTFGHNQKMTTSVPFLLHKDQSFNKVFAEGHMLWRSRGKDARSRMLLWTPQMINRHIVTHNRQCLTDVKTGRRSSGEPAYTVDSVVQMWGLPIGALNITPFGAMQGVELTPSHFSVTLHNATSIAMDWNPTMVASCTKLHYILKMVQPEDYGWNKTIAEESLRQCCDGETGVHFEDKKATATAIMAPPMCPLLIPYSDPMFDVVPYIEQAYREQESPDDIFVERLGRVFTIGQSAEVKFPATTTGYASLSALYSGKKVQAPSSVNVFGLAPRGLINAFLRI